MGFHHLSNDSTLDSHMNECLSNAYPHDIGAKVKKKKIRKKKEIKETIQS